jgi:hypothetical protein
MNKPKKLPKEIFVCWEDDGENGFLDATATTVGIENGEKVGIYQLVAVKTQKVTEELV